MAENVRQELAKALETKRELEQLLDSPVWRKVMALMQTQVDGLQQEVLFTPCLGIDSAMGQEYKKGQIEGRLSISTLVQAEIEMCEMDIVNLRRKQDDYGNDASGNDEHGTSGEFGAP